MSSVRFKYDDFAKKAALMPQEYSEEVMKLASREGAELVMDRDAYMLLKSRYSTSVAPPASVMRKAGCKTCGKKK